MIERVQAYIREHGLMHAGDRVGVAVSGGADSVALLRILLELREELGIVLSVVHFHHGIRGQEADDDQAFVEALAREHGLECRVGRGDAPTYAREHGLSLEAAARELRHGFFEDLLSRALERIATAHTLDDQAETVLMRVLRGAGTRGLAGIYAVRTMGRGSLVRPLLAVRRRELRAHLDLLRQPWREDSSNLDLRHLRNRLRRELLPELERNFNPAIAQVLSDSAEVARAEEEYCAAVVAGILPQARSADGALVVRTLLQQPLALQRRLVRAVAEEAGVALEFDHVNEILRLAAQPASNKTCELPGGWTAVRGHAELRFLSPAEKHATPTFSYALPVPGEVAVTELGTVIRASLDTAAEAAGYNPAQLWRGKQLLVRNWRAGDRFRPLHTKSEKKLKELLQPLRIDRARRAAWPVVAAGDKIVWVRGLPPAADAPGVRIEEFGPSPSSS